jgi:DNA-binding transcriptional ArsR family regulator
MKSARQLQRHFKGAANHWRIRILFVVADEDGITVEQITQRLVGEYKNISQHTHRLVQAGLLDKSYQGRQVTHKLSPYGERFVRFIKTF